MFQKNWMATFMALAVLFTGTLASAQNKNDVVGVWNYEVPNAPYGYQKGKITISLDKEKNLKGEVEFQDGYKIKIKDIELKEGKVILGMNIDYEYIKTEVSVNGKTMEGFVNSPDGKLKLTAKKS